MFFQKEDYEGEGSGLVIKRPVLILVLPLKTPTTKLLHLIMPQFPHVYEGDEVTVLAKMVLEVNRIFHEKYSA